MNAPARSRRWCRILQRNALGLFALLCANRLCTCRALVVVSMETILGVASADTDRNAADRSCTLGSGGTAMASCRCDQLTALTASAEPANITIAFCRHRVIVNMRDPFHLNFPHSVTFHMSAIDVGQS